MRFGRTRWSLRLDECESAGVAALQLDVCVSGLT